MVNSPWFLIIVLFLIAWLVFGNIRVFKNYFLVKEKYNTEIEHKDSLHIRNKQLDTDIHRLQTDEGLDYEIRKKLDIAKPDEKVIKVMERE